MPPYFKVYVHTFLSSIYVNFLLKSEVDGFEKKNKQMESESKVVLRLLLIIYLNKQDGVN